MKESEKMEMQNIYKPIIDKLNAWAYYEENRPKTEYQSDSENHDRFRKENDLDCILRENNLNADTIFSLWLPLRFALVRVSGYDMVEKIVGTRLEQSIKFYRSLANEEKLKQLLPIENETTQLLSQLFELGQQVENTMILPERWMQKRGGRPYYDYMPYFLYECFDKGNFSEAFESDQVLIQWIEDEYLQHFFDKEICKENIIDLAGTGDIKNGIPRDLNQTIRSYINILQSRANDLKNLSAQ